MNRSKLNKLMSRASTLALAALGATAATGSAQAAQNCQDFNPINSNFDINAIVITNDTNCVNVDTKNVDINVDGNSIVIGDDTEILGVNDSATDVTAVYLFNTVLEGRFLNNGRITSGTTGTSLDGVGIDASVLNGGFTNSGVITGEDDAVSISDTTFEGGFVNNGELTGGSGNTSNTGLVVTNDSTDTMLFSGGILNGAEGVISGSRGIDISGVDRINFRDGITNSGDIFAGKSTAVRVNGDVDFEGGIYNLLNAEISSDNSTAIEISVDGAFEGGIHNSGSIIGHEISVGGGAHAILVGDTVSDFRGGITNSGLISTGTSVSGGGQSTAIQIEAQTFGDSLDTNFGILNQVGGRLVAIDDGISIDNTTNLGLDVYGGITNAGSINAGETGIYVSVDTFQGGISNSGNITADTGDGIHLEEGTFRGGILISGGTIDAGYDGIKVEDTVVFSTSVEIDGISNAGRIIADQDGIDIEAESFWGGVANSGTITAGDIGIEIGEGGEENFFGGVTNSGTIFAGGTGIEVLVESFDGGITNSGTIQGDVGGPASMGIAVAGTTFAGGIKNLAGGNIDVANTGIRVDVTQSFTGGVTNAGNITADAYAIYIDPITFNGGVTNSGGLTAEDGTALYLSADDINGKIYNDATGEITATDGRGIFVVNGAYTSTVNDGFENRGAINTSGTTTASVGVDFDVVEFAGGFTNSGSIIAQHDHAVRIVADSIAGGFRNTTNGEDIGYIQSVDSGTGVLIEAAEFDGGFTNAGTIIAASNGADAVHLSVDLFGEVSGGFTNSGKIDGGDDGLRIESLTDGAGVFHNGIHNLLGAQILAGETGIEVDLETFNGGLTNAGLIESSTDDAVNFEVTDFNGNFINSGKIISNGEDGVDIAFSDTFNGNITNTGTIEATDDSIVNLSAALELSGDTFAGNIVNENLIRLADTGINLLMANFTGNFTNTATGEISATRTGVHFNNEFDAGLQTFDGEFSNAGDITGTQYGVFVDGVDTFGGSITNSGAASSINSSTGFALYLLDVGTFEGGITNAGTIASLNDTALYIEGTTIGGRITNSGLIRSGVAGDDAIDINGGHVTGGIFNSGTIQASDDALELSDTDLATTFTQTAGAVIGDIRLDQEGTERVDTLNFDGGTMLGDIDGSASSDVMNVAAGSGSFAYLSGTIDGLSQLNIDSGTGIFGGLAVGTQGMGVSGGEGIEDINVNGGTLYLDDDTRLRADDTYDQETDAEVQFLLSLDGGNEKSGQITGGTLVVRGQVTGVIDLAAFAGSGGLTGPFVYENVFDGSTSLSYNVAPTDLSILNDLIFFTIEDDVDLLDDTVDLIVNRLSFSEVLADASQSSNQQAVGEVLEQLFNSGTTSSDFDEAFAALLGSSSYDEALAIYDQLLGAEHAQAALGMFNSMGQFQGFLGERMDVLHNGMGSAQWAMFGQPGTQVAAAETVLADASPTPGMGGGSMATTRSGNTISMFGGVNGNWASVEGDTNGPGFDQDTFGLNAGVDYAFSSETVVGLGGSYQASELEFESNNSGDVDTVAVGLFGTFGLGGGYLDTNANVGFHDVSTSRLTPALDYASAEYSATSWSLSGELGSVIPVGRAYVAPMLSMTYVGVSVDGFTETGSALALTVDSADTNSFATVLGARAGNYFKVGKTTVNLQGNLGWRHEFGDEESSFTAAFIEEPALLFNVDSSKIASDSATFGLGTTVSLSTRMEVFVNYDGVWNAEADSHNASLGVRSTW